MALSKITTESILDDEVTLAKMAGGTDGNIISYDASGDPVAIATGNDGQVLTSTGAGSPPAFEDAGGGAWNLIGTSVASSSSDLTQTGLDSTYDTYVVLISDLVSSVDDAKLLMRFGDSGGLDSGASDYHWRTERVDFSGSSYSSSVDTSDSSIRLNEGNLGSGAGEGLGGVFYLHQPADGTMWPLMTGIGINIDSTPALNGFKVFGARAAVITMDRVSIFMASGNIASGRMSVYGISHT